MGAKDTETKAYLKSPERVADVFNFIMYGGKQIIRSENLQELDTTSVALPYGNGVKEPLQKIRDALKLYSAMKDDKAIYLILGIEAQSEVHYAMPVRTMLYDSMSYTEQVSRIAAINRNSEKKLGKAEFLSGFTKDDRLTPVITVVMLFSPDKWDAPLSIHEMLNTQDKTILSFAQDYKINLISPAEIADMDFDKFQTGLGAVMQFIKHQNEENMEWIKEYKRFEEVDFESASLIKTTTGTNFQIKKGESVNMCKAWQNSINKAKEEARKETEKNMRTAWAKSLDKAKEEARNEAIREAEKNMRTAWQNSLDKAKEEARNEAIRETEKNMRTAWQNSLDKAKEEARKETEKNMRTAWQNSLNKAKEEGYNDMLLALKMLKESIAIEKISKDTGCSTEVLMQLKNIALSN